MSKERDHKKRYDVYDYADMLVRYFTKNPKTGWGKKQIIQTIERLTIWFLKKEDEESEK